MLTKRSGFARRRNRSHQGLIGTRYCGGPAKPNKLTHKWMATIFRTAAAEVRSMKPVLDHYAVGFRIMHGSVPDLGVVDAPRPRGIVSPAHRVTRSRRCDQAGSGAVAEERRSMTGVRVVGRRNAASASLGRMQAVEMSSCIVGISLHAAASVVLFPSPYSMGASTPYAAIVKPTSTTSIQMDYKTFASSAHQAAESGSNGYAINRNTGAFASQNSNLDRYGIGIWSARSTLAEAAVVVPLA